MLIMGLLRRHGLNSKLIQSNEGFYLSDLYELRRFSELVLDADDSSTIDNDDWAESVRRFCTNESKSDKLELVLRMIHDFNSVNPVRKYKSDWKVFLKESKLEDFIRIDSDIIYVSTIHKSKGKEFDNVYILAKGPMPDKDESRRRLYVAITRAKQNLNLHYNAKYLQNLSADNLIYRHNNSDFPEPDHLSFSLNHKNVNLGYFTYAQSRIDQLHSGAKLLPISGGLANEQGQQVLRFSQTYAATLQQYLDKGFKISSAKVQFIVYWSNEDVKEMKIILPEISLTR